MSAREAAERRPPRGCSTEDEQVRQYLLTAAANYLSGPLYRPVDNLREMLREEVERLQRAGHPQLIDALERAKRKIVSNIRAGAR